MFQQTNIIISREYFSNGIHLSNNHEYMKDIKDAFVMHNRDIDLSDVKCKKEIVELLIKKGANVNSKDNDSLGKREARNPYSQCTLFSC